MNYSNFTCDEKGKLYSNFWFNINYFSYTSEIKTEHFKRPQNKTVNIYDKYHQLIEQFVYKDSLVVLYKSFTNNSITTIRKIIDDKISYSYFDEDGLKTITITDSISQERIHYYSNGKLKSKFNSNVLNQVETYYSYDEYGNLKFIKTVRDKKKIIFETKYFKYILLPDKEGGIFSIQKVNMNTGIAKTPYIID